jgi:hypothetical protein
MLPNPQQLSLPLETPSPAATNASKASTHQASAFQGQSCWAAYQTTSQDTTLALLDHDDPLELSPTALETFVKCPQQFFYKHLLYLRGPQAQAAMEGVGLHRLMAAFHQLPSAEQTQATLRTMVKALLADPPQLDTLRQQDPTYTQEDVAFLTELDPIAQFDLRQRLRRAFDDLLAQGFAQAPPKQVLREEDADYRNIHVPGLADATFRARLDALIQDADGAWHIVDYKFYQSGTRYGQTTDKSRNGQLAKVFSPLDDTATTHANRFGPAHNRNYQLPIAYLVTQYAPTTDTGSASPPHVAPNIAGQVATAALQIIRPPVLGSPGVGANRVTLDRDTLESGLPQLLADLTAHVVSPIRTQATLPKNPDPKTCEQCSFRQICDQGWQPAQGAMTATATQVGNTL